MSLGFAIGFAITEVKTFSANIWIMIAVLLVSMTCYYLLEIFKSKFGQKMCCKRDLGFFNGPKSKGDIDNKDLMEDMLDVHLGDKPLDSSINSYVPPTLTPRAVTYSAGDFNHKLCKKKISKSRSEDVGDGLDIIPEEPSTSNGSEEVTNVGDEQKEKLSQTAAF